VVTVLKAQVLIGKSYPGQNASPMSGTGKGRIGDFDDFADFGEKSFSGTALCGRPDRQLHIWL